MSPNMINNENLTGSNDDENLSSSSSSLERSPYLFFLPNFLNYSDNNNNQSDNSTRATTPEEAVEEIQEDIIQEEIVNEDTNNTSNDATNTTNMITSTPIIPISTTSTATTTTTTTTTVRSSAHEPYINRMERLSDEPILPMRAFESQEQENDSQGGEDDRRVSFREENSNINENENRNRNDTIDNENEPRRLVTNERTSSYGILSSNTSLLSIDETAGDDPLGNNNEREFNDDSVQNLIALLDRIHRINMLSRAIEEERRRQREMEREQERQRERELMMNSEQSELNSFVSLLNTMIFLISADRQLRRPLMEDYPINDDLEGREENDQIDNNDDDGLGIGREQRTFRTNSQAQSQAQGQMERQDQTQSEIRYIRPNPNPIIATPFMYARFEPERSSATTRRDSPSIFDDENAHETPNDTNPTRINRPFITRPQNNLMFINVPLSFDLANLIQLLSFSSPHRHPGASKEAMENATRILTPEMMKFGTRLQNQPNCIICQEDFITNVNKRLRSKTSLLKIKSEIDDGKPTEKEEGEEKEKEGKEEKVSDGHCEDYDDHNDVDTDDDNIRLMPCGHIFHECCLFQWLKDNNTCPVCRYELETEDEEYNEGVHKRMAERGIDIPSFNIDFTFFCSLEKSGQCQCLASNRLLKKRLEGGSHSLAKCNSIENLISHAITQSNTMNMRYVRLPCCNHEFHWPCFKEALVKAGYQWEEEEDEAKKQQEPFYIPPKKKSLKIKTPMKNKKSDRDTIGNVININFNSNNHKSENVVNNRNLNNNNDDEDDNKAPIIENDIIITDLEDEEEIEHEHEEVKVEEGEEEDNIDYSIQSSSQKPTIKKVKSDEWMEIKCPVCMKINKIPVAALKSKEQVKPTTMIRSKSLTTLPKSLSIEKLELRKLTTNNSLMNLNLYNNNI